MKRYILILFFITEVFQIKAQTNVVDSILSGGIYRSYRLYIPAIYNRTTPRPLVINLHGYKMTAFMQQAYTNFGFIADTANFLVVCPQGTNDPQNQPFWNSAVNPTLANDVEFISNLIDHLATHYNIDLNRVYSTGMSNGGFMSHTLACELNSRIAAIASVAGSMLTTQYGSNCHPSKPMPVMEIHGSADPKVPYTGGLWDSLIVIMPVDSVVDYWVKYNNCTSTPVFSNVPNTNVFDFSTAEHYVYGNGNLGSTVELYKIIGGGHTWPGALVPLPSGGITNQDLKATKTIWNFFRKYSLSQFTNIGDNDKKNNTAIVYPNPTSKTLNLVLNESIQPNTNVEIEVIDVLGNSVLITTTSNQSISVDRLNSGVYYLVIKSYNNYFKPIRFIKQ